MDKEKHREREIDRQRARMQRGSWITSSKCAAVQGQGEARGPKGMKKRVDAGVDGEGGSGSTKRRRFKGEKAFCSRGWNPRSDRDSTRVTAAGVRGRGRRIDFSPTRICDRQGEKAVPSILVLC